VISLKVKICFTGDVVKEFCGYTTVFDFLELVGHKEHEIVVIPVVNFGSRVSK